MSHTPSPVLTQSAESSAALGAPALTTVSYEGADGATKTATIPLSFDEQFSDQIAATLDDAFYCTATDQALMHGLAVIPSASRGKKSRPHDIVSSIPLDAGRRLVWDVPEKLRYAMKNDPLERAKLVCFVDSRVLRPLFNLNRATGAAVQAIAANALFSFVCDSEYDIPAPGLMRSFEMAFLGGRAGAGRPDEVGAQPAERGASQASVLSAYFQMRQAGDDESDRSVAETERLRIAHAPSSGALELWMGYSSVGERMERSLAESKGSPELVYRILNEERREGSPCWRTVASWFVLTIEQICALCRVSGSRSLRAWLNEALGNSGYCSEIDDSLPGDYIATLVARIDALLDAIPSESALAALFLNFTCGSAAGVLADRIVAAVRQSWDRQFLENGDREKLFRAMVRLCLVAGEDPDESPYGALDRMLPGEVAEVVCRCRGRAAPLDGKAARRDASASAVSEAALCLVASAKLLWSNGDSEVVRPALEPQVCSAILSFRMASDITRCAEVEAFNAAQLRKRSTGVEEAFLAASHIWAKQSTLAGAAIRLALAAFYLESASEIYKAHSLDGAWRSDKAPIVTGDSESDKIAGLAGEEAHAKVAVAHSTATQERRRGLRLLAHSRRAEIEEAAVQFLSDEGFMGALAHAFSAEMDKYCPLTGGPRQASSDALARQCPSLAWWWRRRYLIKSAEYSPDSHRRLLENAVADVINESAQLAAATEPVARATAAKRPASPDRGSCESGCAEEEGACAKRVRQEESAVEPVSA
jgi:hypothetical protein